jgi:hypothetical protein
MEVGLKKNLKQSQKNNGSSKAEVDCSDKRKSSSK